MDVYKKYRRNLFSTREHARVEKSINKIAESFLFGRAIFIQGAKGAVDRKYISRKKLFMTVYAAARTGLLSSRLHFRGFDACNISTAVVKH